MKSVREESSPALPFEGIERVNLRKTRLKRKTPLRAKTPLRRRSVKGDKEARRRQKVYHYLVEHSDGRCGNCGRPLNWYWLGFEMVHKIPLSKLGKTDIVNCQLWCWPCHYGPPGPHHTLSERLYNELTEAYDKKHQITT